MRKQEAKNRSFLSFLSFKINVFELAAILVAVYLAFSAHQSNLENSQRINQLLVKYEQTLDTAIAGDPKTFRTYKENLQKALAGLSPEEKKVLESVLSLSRSDK